MKSETSDPCPHDFPCETLDVYVSNESAYFTDNTCFIFLPGTHTLNSTVSIHNVTNVALVGNADLNEGNVTIQCNGSGGLVFQHASHVKLVNLSFVSCGQSLPDSLQRENETAQAALAFGEVTDLLLDSVSVSHSTGYGVLGLCAYGDFNITNSNLTFNRGNEQYLGGNMVIDYTNCIKPEKIRTKRINIFSSIFAHGSYGTFQVFATGLTLILSETNITVLIKDTVMNDNSNSMMHGVGGNLFIHFYNDTSFTSNNVTIVNSIFRNGASWAGSGIAVTLYISDDSTTEQTGSCTNVLNLTSLEIKNNTSIVGSGLYFEIKTDKSNKKCYYINTTIFNSTFDNNSIEVKPNFAYHYRANGAAVHMFVKSVNNFIEKSMNYYYYTNFENCTFKNSRLLLKNSTINKFTKLELAIVAILVENFRSDATHIENCDIVDNELSGIGLSNSKVHMIGNNLIRNNKGIFGGGLQLCEFSYIILRKDSSITFINNHAGQLGGGIYVASSCLYTKPFCFYQLDNKDRCHKDKESDIKFINITMINNTAGYAGDHIYGGGLSNCEINECDSTKVFQAIFTVTPNNTKSNLSISSVTSGPTGMCFCLEGKPACPNQTINISEAKYPGENIHVDVAAVGQFNGTVPGAVAYFTRDSNLKPKSVITKMCTEIQITIETLTPQTIHIILSLASQFESGTGNITYLSFSQYREIVVQLKDCPPGFNLYKRICDCDEKLKDKDILCNITSHSVLRTPPAWIGYNNNTDSTTSEGIIYHSVCPYDYCINDEVNITSDTNTFDQDSQCSPNRT